MNRDAIVATIIGFGVGLVITGIFLLGPNLAKHLPTVTFPAISLPKAQPTSTPTPKSVSFSIDAPLPDSIETTGSVLVSGNSPTGSLVVIEGESDEVIVVANGDAKYAGKVSLEEGKNEIIVTSYVKEKPSRQSVTVFYTPEKF